MSTPNDSGAAARSKLAQATETAKKVSVTARDQSKRAFDKGVDMSSRLSTGTLAWWGIAMAAVLLLTTNLVVGNWFRNWRADLTEDGLYSISQSTRKVLAGLDEPITMQVYYTRALGEQAPAYGQHFQRVRTLLERYRDLSGGKLRLAFINPQAFSDAEDRAVGSGLKGIRLNSEGDMAYFGLVATNTTDNVERIDFFAPERERFLEYDLTKLVNALSKPKRKVVGMISGLPLEGGPGSPMTGNRPQPPWAILGQIREFFELRTLQQDVKEIPGDIDTLMLVHPNGLTPEAALAIDQFALKGGRILAFIDPVPEIARVFSMGRDLPPATELGKLLDGWGVKIDTSKVAADIAQARRVQFGGGQTGMPASVTEYVVWLSLDKRALEANDSITAQVETINSASMGALSTAEKSTLKLTPILQTTERGAIVDADKVSMRPDPLSLLRGYQPGGKRLVMAGRFTGEVKTAFPKGIEPPAPEKKEDEPKKDEASKPGEKSDNAAVKAEPDKKAAEAAAAPKATPPPLTTGQLNAIVIADTDLLHDQFWLDERDFLGQRIQIPLAHNAVLVVNALENLTGGEALRDLRGRGVKQRPFTVVDEIKRDAEKQFREKEQALQAKLKDAQQKLEGIQQKGEGGNIVLTDKDRETIERFKAEMLSTRRELRDVRLALNQDIDRLGSTVKFINIAAVPLLIGLGAIGLVLMRRRSDRAARGETAKS
jgi:ABC-type uncharacterized transport system involved in gliding motility auxiliary subunit